MLDVEKITPAIGGIVKGVDFSRPLDARVQGLIYEALLEHQVIFFRGVEITPQAHLDFARSFGIIDCVIWEMHSFRIFGNTLMVFLAFLDPIH